MKSEDQDFGNNPEVEIVSPSEMMKTTLEARLMLKPQEVSSLFDHLMIEKLDGAMPFRTVFNAVPVLWRAKLISEDQLERFMDKMVDVLQQERAQHYPDIAALPKMEADKDNPTTIVVVGVNEDKTLREVAGMFRPGQEERFVRENFQPKVLDYLYDMCANPGDYQGKMLAKWLFKIVSKLANPDKLVDVLTKTVQFTWKDDGLSENASFKAYLAKSEIKNNNAFKA